MKPAPAARKYCSTLRSQRRRAVTAAPPTRSASPATAPSASDSSNADMAVSLRLGSAVPADAEQLEVVGPDPGAEVRPLEWTAAHVLDAPARLADEVMVVSPDVVGQLVAGRPIPQLDPPGELEALQKVHGAVDRGEVHAPATGPLAEPVVDLIHPEGRGRRDQDLEDDRAGASPGVPGTGQDYPDPVHVTRPGPRHDCKHFANGFRRCQGKLA